MATGYLPRCMQAAHREVDKSWPAIPLSFSEENDMAGIWCRKESSPRIRYLGGPGLLEHRQKREEKWEDAHVTFSCHFPKSTPNPHPISFSSSFSLPGPSSSPCPQATWCCLCRKTLSVCPRSNGPRVGIYAAWLAQALPLEDVENESDWDIATLL